MYYYYEVIVELKPEVLDAEGRAICQTIQRLGYEILEDIKVSKRFVIKLTQDDEAVVKELAEKFLVQPVSQNYQIRRLHDEHKS